MKKTEAVQHLQTMMIAIQRVRSIINESDARYAGKDLRAREILANIEQEDHPYIFGKKCPLAVLSRILDGDVHMIEPNTYSNMMYIAFELEPIIGIAAGIYADDNFPREWSINMVRPFEDK